MGAKYVFVTMVLIKTFIKHLVMFRFSAAVHITFIFVYITLFTLYNHDAESIDQDIKFINKSEP